MQTGTVTCDNTSNNDKFFDCLATLLPSFPGRQAQVRYFAHTLNLTAKSTLRQFEVRKRRDGTIALNEDPDIIALAAGLEYEGNDTQALAVELGENDVVKGDDGTIEPPFEMEGFDIGEWRAATRPVRQALIKVSFS